ncbi:MAG: type II toxin-antitoxin system RelE/ParE family toxin [Candidatus Omnitrophica bacterium]|nr:type II toxin-antitoxin system RelE/ParE family toxin [Candidatus Omnitrophota bacterium]
MRYLKNNRFQRDLKNNGLDDENLESVLDDIFDGRATPLGSKFYKIRGAKEGKGKRSGFRTLFFWKKEKIIVFCLLFAKNEQDNLTSDEKKVLKILSNEYDKLTDGEIQRLINEKTFTEIGYVKK